MTRTLTARELQLDLLLAFPGIDVEPLPEDSPRFAGPKLWFQEQVLMADQCPVFLLPHQLEGREVPGYSRGARIHEGFLVWCAIRGWQVIAYDSPVHVLVPTAAVLAEAEAFAAATPAETDEINARDGVTERAKRCKAQRKPTPKRR